MTDPADRAAAEAQGTILGHAALTGQRIDGWCLYPDDLERRASIDIFIDGRIVRSMRATLYRDDLVTAGLGDGYFGFVLSLSAALLTGTDTLIEVKDQRLRRTFARMMPGRPARMAAEHRRLDEAEGRIKALLLRVSQIDGRFAHHAFAELGRMLGHVGASRRPTSDTVLALAHETVAGLPRLDLGCDPHPVVSLVVPASRPAAVAAQAIRHTRLSLRDVPMEAMILDDGRDPAIALLPTRLRHLRILRVDHPLTSSAALNEMILGARAARIALVAEPSRLNGFALADVLSRADDRTAYINGERLGGAAAAHGPDMIIERPAARSGLDCVIPRRLLAEVGGFDQLPGESRTAMWRRLAARLFALGAAIVQWYEPADAFEAVR